MMLKTVLAGAAAGLTQYASADAFDVNTAIQNFHSSVFMQQQQGVYDPSDVQKLSDKETTVPCQYWYDDKWYDLTSFNSDVEYFVTTPATNQYAAFNFCQKISKASTTDLQCDQSESSVFDAYATLIGVPSTNQCEAASTSSYSSISTTSYKVSNDESTFGLKYKNSDNGCSLTVGLICGDNDDYTTTDLVFVSGGAGCDYKTTLTSSQVCASFDLNALWAFLGDYSYLWGALLIIGGIFLGFFGRKLFKAAIFMVTAILVVFGILLLFYTTFLDDATEAWVGWTVLSCSILIGLVAGFFMMKLERVGAALLAGWGGFLIGVLLNEMVLYKAESQALFWCISIGCGIVAAVLSFFIYEHVLINMTAFAGAYMLIRGISLYAGGFPNEFTLADQLKAGDTSAFTNWFYLYMAGIVIMAIVCSIVQYKTNNKEEDNPYDKLK